MKNNVTKKLIFILIPDLLALLIGVKMKLVLLAWIVIVFLNTNSNSILMKFSYFTFKPL